MIAITKSDQRETIVKALSILRDQLNEEIKKLFSDGKTHWNESSWTKLVFEREFTEKVLWEIKEEHR